MKSDTQLGSARKQERVRSAAIFVRLSVAVIVVSALISIGPAVTIRAQSGSQIQYANRSFAAGANPSAAAVGDLDADGLRDIAVVNFDGSLQLFFNNGASSFQRVTLAGLWPSGFTPLDIDIGDLNADGRNDLVVAVSTPAGSVSVLLNIGNRGYAAPVNYDLCGSSKGIAIGDLDQDGDSDLADISQCSKSGVLLNDGRGTFGLSGLYGGGSASKSVVLADLNGDGRKDISWVNSGIGINGNITVVLNNGNGTFGAPAWFYAGDLPDDLAAGDFEGDGIADVAIANAYYSQVIILFSDGGGTFSGYSELYGDTPSSITASDLNSDGRPDIAAASWTTNRLQVFMNLGNYNFSDPLWFNVGQGPVDVDAGDLDGDGRPDLVVVNQRSGSITVLLSGGGVSDPPPPPPPITLTVSTAKTKLTRLVDLRWSGITGTAVRIYRNGSQIATASNNGSFTDRLNVRTTGTFTYKVCASSGTSCSRDVSISF